MSEEQAPGEYQDSGTYQPPTLQAWASEPDPSTRLQEMEPGESTGTVQHPFSTIDRESYLASVRGSGIARRSQFAPIALVNLSDLVAIQGSVNTERVSQHLSDPRMVQPGTRAPGHGMLVDRPLVVRKNGMLFVHDGTHRLTAAWCRGQETAKVRFVDLDAEDPR